MKNRELIAMLSNMGLEDEVYIADNEYGLNAVERVKKVPETYGLGPNAIVLEWDEEF